jgi:hypothetical protein
LTPSRSSVMNDSRTAPRFIFSAVFSSRVASSGISQMEKADTANEAAFIMNAT